MLANQHYPDGLQTKVLVEELYKEADPNTKQGVLMIEAAELIAGEWGMDPWSYEEWLEKRK